MSCWHVCVISELVVWKGKADKLFCQYTVPVQEAAGVSWYLFVALSVSDFSFLGFTWANTTGNNDKESRNGGDIYHSLYEMDNTAEEVKGKTHACRLRSQSYCRKKESSRVGFTMRCKKAWRWCSERKPRPQLCPGSHSAHMYAHLQVHPHTNRVGQCWYVLKRKTNSSIFKPVMILTIYRLCLNNIKLNFCGEPFSQIIKYLNWENKHLTAQYRLQTNTRKWHVKQYN